jgi:hypothetical protein
MAGIGECVVRKDDLESGVLDVPCLRCLCIEIFIKLKMSRSKRCKFDRSYISAWTRQGGNSQRRTSAKQTMREYSFVAPLPIPSASETCIFALISHER